MPLVDYQIVERCERDRMIFPFIPSLVNPSSIDVRIGIALKAERPWWARIFEGREREWDDIDLADYSQEQPYWLRPNQFILVSTLESFNIPFDLAGEFKIKSSRAREGYNNILAVWLDNGWHGSVLTLELKNYRRHAPLPIYPGLKIGQIIFHETATPSRHYGQTGRYNNDTTVTTSKG